MIFDSLDLPKEIGASDLQDSARLAGLMATFGILNEGMPIPLELYFKDGKYVRHPNEYRYDFSRDQTLCYVAGLYFQNLKHLVNLKYVNGIDIFTPAHRGHVARCQGRKASKFQDMWFWFDVWRACFKSPTAENNQLLCMLMVADKKYLKYYLANNKKWRSQIEHYWCGWRNEPELALKIIQTLEVYEPKK